MTGLLLLALLAAPLPESSRPAIDFSTAPYTHAGIPDFGEPNARLSTYSGRWLVHVQQWGVIVINADTGIKTMLSPVETEFGCTHGGCYHGETCFQPPIHKSYFCDCFQSVIFLVATPGTPKWVVTSGYGLLDRFTEDHASPFQVYSLTDTKLTYKGGVGPTPGIYELRNQLRLDGDTLWISEGVSPTPLFWSKVDLNTRQVVTAGVPTSQVPAFTPQPNIDGFTYKISIREPNTNCDYSATRSDVAVVTSTPAPPSPLVSFTKTRTAVQTPLPCCDPDKMPCPLGATLCYKTPTRAPSTTRYPTSTRTIPRTATAALRTTTQSPIPSATVTARATFTHTPIPPVPSPTASVPPPISSGIGWWVWLVGGLAAGFGIYWFAIRKGEVSS